VSGGDIRPSLFRDAAHFERYKFVNEAAGAGW